MHPFVQYTGAGSWFTFCTRRAMHYVFYAIHFIRYHVARLTRLRLLMPREILLVTFRQCVRCIDGAYLRQLFHHSFSKYSARHKIDSTFVIFQMKSSFRRSLSFKFLLAKNPARVYASLDPFSRNTSAFSKSFIVVWWFFAYVFLVLL